MNIETFLNKYQNRIWEGCTDKHRIEAVNRVRQLISVNGDMPYERLSVDHVYKLLDKLRGANFSDATVNRYIAAISAFMKYARSIGFSTKRFDIKTTKEKSRIRFFSPQELAGIDAFSKLNYVPAWFGHMCNVARYTGMRHGEVLRLFTMDKVELNYDEADGTLWITLFDTKNGDDRHIPVAAPSAIKSAEALQSHKYNEKLFRRLWGEMRHKVGKRDPQFLFHVFRHSAASTMANELNLNVVIVGQWLGHRSMETTKKYIHAKRDTLGSVAQQMARAG